MVNLSQTKINTIIYMYVNERKSATKLAEEFKISITKILSVLRAHKVEIRRSVLTVKEKRDIIKRYVAGESSTKLCKDYGVAKGTVLNLLAKNNIERRDPGTPRNVPKEDRNKVVERYMYGETAEDIAKSYGCYNGEILRIIHKAGVKVRKYVPMEHEENRAKKRDNVLDENFFLEIDEEKQAYWLAFIAGDGHIRKNTLVVKLKGDDDGHLKKFLKMLKATYEIKERVDEVDFGDGNGPQKYKSATVSVCSRKLCDSIRKHLNLGDKTEKTYDLKFPKAISSHLYKHLIRGWLESDGSIQYYGTPDCKVCFYGTEDVCRTIRDILVAECGVSNLAPKPKGPTNKYDGQMFEIKWGGTIQILKILDWLYGGATIFLDRKYTQYKSIERREFTNILDFTSGNRIRNRRKQLGLSRKDLAIRIGCSISYINGMENEYRTTISSMIADKLFLVLGLDKNPEEDKKAKKST
ncbi:helix-turn-helix domain-containing protein [Mesobacillus maritimus]|uniref:helix-turn-helix domain-containing protein n=1 Tax=Mesobacillus maritimus TaxID=1643336 RepID=UPI00203EF31E|nr:helix-turn-helix domain-containing protein [Mesobacillus maritimus]MCM3584261.1 helix-turn-helix domain-containing protein [Mesobacillus maritimus]